MGDLLYRQRQYCFFSIVHNGYQHWSHQSNDVYREPLVNQNLSQCEEKTYNLYPAVQRREVHHHTAKLKQNYPYDDHNSDRSENLILIIRNTLLQVANIKYRQNFTCKITALNGSQVGK